MLHVKNVTYRVGGRVLLDDASVALPPNARVGFVGRNGTGKTTLFRMILGDIGPDAGTITVPRGMRIGEVAQEAPGGPETLLEVVLAADKERVALEEEAETASDPDRIAEIHSLLADRGAHAAPSRAAKILAGLGFDDAAQQRPCSSFSGGWRMRVALAALLFVEPDLLLLDEPTNYLDLEGTLWLQDYLAEYPHTVIVISHDRDLLNASVDAILHLDKMKLTFYRGTYDTFDRTRREQQALSAKLRKKQEEQRAHLQAFVDRFRAKASKATQAQSRLKMLARLEPVAAMVDDDVRPFNFPEPKKKLAPPILQMESASAGYGETQILKRLSLSIDVDDRIGLLGSNGNGKSTFAKLVAGRLAPMGGRVSRANGMNVAYFAQHQLDDLHPEETALDHVARLMPGEHQAKIRSCAAQFGFPAQKVETPVKNLSGGEKARLLMGLATFGGANLLILDEPTNHLDIDSREALVQALNEFPGAVILISHDRHLIDATVDRLWLVSDGTVKAFEGDLDDYRDLVLKKPVKARAKEPEPTTQPTPASLSPKKIEKSPLRDRVRAFEIAMGQLQEIIADLDRRLATPGIFTRAPEKAAEMAKSRAIAAERLALAEEGWLQAQEALEKAA